MLFSLKTNDSSVSARRPVFHHVRFFLVAAVMVVAPLILFRAALGDEGLRRYSYTEKRELLWEEGKPLIIRESGGTIYTRGWKKEEIRVKAIKTAFAPQLSLARRNASLLDVAIEAPHDRVSIRTINPSLKTGEIRSHVDYSLNAPRAINLDLKTVEGGIFAINFEGTVTARTASGSLLFRGVTGRALAESDTGDITIEECPNLISAKTGAGDIEYILGEKAPEIDTELETEGGNVIISFIEETPLILVVAAGPEKIDALEASVTVNTETSGDSDEEIVDDLETKKYYSGGGGKFIRVTAASGTVTIKTVPPPEEDPRQRKK